MHKNFTLSIDTNVELKNYYLSNLSDGKVSFTSGTAFDIQNGWYNLIVEYHGEKVDITDITINGQSIGHFLHTGFFTETSTGKRFQPANSLWTEGFYSIWIHTEIGHMLQTHARSIRNGDYGKDLFDDYLFTVDKSIEVDDNWPEMIKSYFRHGNGPRWWKKDLKRTPYEVCEESLLQDCDKTKILREIPIDCEIEIEYEMPTKESNTKNKIMQGRAIRRNSVYPYIEIDTIKGDELKKLIRKLGFTKILNITLQTSLPGQAFAPHIDDHYDRDCREDIEGPTVFLWDLAEDTTKHLFKLGVAGVLPLDNGVFFNQFYYDHGTINDSNTVERPLLIIHGKRDKELPYT